MVTYTYNDGLTTTVYGSDWSVTSSTPNASALAEIRDASNNLIGYSTTDADGNTTEYDLDRVTVTGYS